MNKKWQKIVFWALTICLGLGLVGSSVLWTLPDDPSATAPPVQNSEPDSAEPEVPINTQLESRVQADPDNIGLRLQLAAWYRDSGDADKAIAEYNEVISRQPGNDNARVSLAELYYFKGDADQALAQYDALLQANPDHQMALFSSAMILGTEKNDYETAAERMEHYISLVGSGPEADQARAILEQWKKQ